MFILFYGKQKEIILIFFFDFSVYKVNMNSVKYILENSPLPFEKLDQIGQFINQIHGGGAAAVCKIRKFIHYYKRETMSV